jgi:hypothetical protein
MWANGGHHAFRVTIVDDTGVQCQGGPGDASASISMYAGTGTFWFWPSVPPQATQLRVTVGTLREAAWALIDIPAANPAHSEMAQIRRQTRHPQVQKAPPLKLSHPGQRLIRGSDPMAKDTDERPARRTPPGGGGVKQTVDRYGASAC